MDGLEQKPKTGTGGLAQFFRYVLPLALIVISIIVVLILVGIARNKRPEQVEGIDQAVLVDTLIAQQRTLNFTVHSQGTVQPRTETTLVAEVSGKIASVSPGFVAGGFFRQGDVLLQIDPSDYETALKRAEAALASRQARLADEKARSEQALKDWQNLGRGGEPSDLVLRKPQLQDAVANVSAAEADVQKARRDLQRTHITVPYDGLVREKLVDIGQYVTPGTRLGVSFAIDTAEVRLPLSTADMAYLNLPSATNASPEAFPEVTLFSEVGASARSWQAQIIRSEGVVDVTSRVVYAVAQVVDPYRVLGLSTQAELKVGTFVRAAIEGKVAENVIVLPRFVLQNDNTVLVVNDERKLEIRKVTVARSEPRWVYLSSGLSDGEQVISTTLDAPIPGMKLATNPAPRTEIPPEPARDRAVAGENP
jgi:RND family efflux transporter MFP subunit